MATQHRRATHRVDIDEARLEAVEQLLSRLADAVLGRPEHTGLSAKVTAMWHAVFGIENAPEDGMLADIRRLHNKLDAIYKAIVTLAGTIAVAAITIALAIAA